MSCGYFKFSILKKPTPLFVAFLFISICKDYLDIEIIKVINNHIYCAQFLLPFALLYLDIFQRRKAAFKRCRESNEPYFSSKKAIAS